MRTGVNIRKRKDGRYEARYPKGRDAAGKLLYGYCYGHSFEEAREKRDRIMAQRPREMNLLILGAGGHGEIIRELAQSLGVFRKIGFLDDDLKNPLAMGRCDDCLRYLEVAGYAGQKRFCAADLGPSDCHGFSVCGGWIRNCDRGQSHGLARSANREWLYYRQRRDD